MQIDDHFSKLRSRLELNPTFQSAVSQHYNAVKNFLENQGLSYSPKLIGSLQRRTRIQPRVDDDFDIDILVEIGTFYKWVNDGITPNRAIQKMHGHFVSSDRYSQKNPVPDSPTVTFHYSDGVKVELVPAYFDKIGHSSNGIQHVAGRSHWVPTNQGWKLADYDYEASIIKTTNGLYSNLVPLIKQIKAIKKVHMDGVGIDSIHLEILATSIVPTLAEFYTQKGYLQKDRYILEDFFKVASDRLSGNLSFIGSNAEPRLIDPILIPNLRQLFLNISELLSQVNNTNTPYYKQLEISSLLFGDYFPRSLQ